MWPHGSDRSVLHSPNLLYRAESLPGLHIPGFILVPSIGNPGGASWDPHGDDKSQEMSPAKQPEPVRGDLEHEVAKLHLLQGVKVAYF